MCLVLKRIRSLSIIWVLAVNKDQATVYRYHKNTMITPLCQTQRQILNNCGNYHELTAISHMSCGHYLESDFQAGRGKQRLWGNEPYSCQDNLKPTGKNSKDIRLGFAEELTTKLRWAHKNKAFDHLILAASPSILRAIKNQIDSDILDCVIDEINKDYVDEPKHTLLKHLQSTFVEARVA